MQLTSVFIPMSPLQLANECHGPVVIQDLRGEYLLFHIGNGGMASNTSSFMHHSRTPDGPWIPSKTDPGSCGMPTAAFHPNGTLFMVCGVSTTTSPMMFHLPYTHNHTNSHSHSHSHNHNYNRNHNRHNHRHNNSHNNNHNNRYATIPPQLLQPPPPR